MTGTHRKANECRSKMMSRCGPGATVCRLHVRQQHGHGQGHGRRRQFRRQSIPARMRSHDCRYAPSGERIPNDEQTRRSACDMALLVTQAQAVLAQRQTTMAAPAPFSFIVTDERGAEHYCTALVLPEDGTGSGGVLPEPLGSVRRDGFNAALVGCPHGDSADMGKWWPPLWTTLAAWQPVIDGDGCRRATATATAPAAAASWPCCCTPCARACRRRCCA